MKGHTLKKGDTVQVTGCISVLNGQRGLVESVRQDVVVVQLDNQPHTLLFIHDELVKL
jgi:hypothetical protein